MTTVVVADDSPTLRRIVAGVLESAGLDVVVAEDGVGAIQAVFRSMPDVVVLDVQMPRLSGYVAARVLKDDWQTADIPVLFLSSLNAASDRYWGARAGAERFLTKDFEAPELVDAVQQVLASAERARGGRPALKPDPMEISDADVLARVTDLLDRKLFELSVTSDVTAIAVDVLGFEETVAALLQTLVDVVDCDLVGLLLLDERATYVSVAHECSEQQYREFLTSVATASAQATGTEVAISELGPRLADPHRLLGADEETGMATFLSMPLMAGGRLLGLLALSSSSANAFGESALTTLRLVASPAAVVVDHARLTRATNP